MCRDTGLSNGGGGGGNGVQGGDNGGFGGGGDLYSKRIKRQKVPKRGPGVAELEKLLREQRKNDTENGEGFLVSFFSDCHQPTSSNVSPPTSTHCRSLPFGPNPNGFKSGGLVLPDHALSPKVWTPCETNGVNDDGGRSASGITFPPCLTNSCKSNQLFLSPANWKGQGQGQTQRSLDFCDLSSELKVSSSSRTPSSGLSNGLEHPSNQKAQYHCSSSLWPEEYKMSGTKCTCPFSKEIPPLPPFHFQVQALPLFASSSKVQNSFNFGPTETTFRKTKSTGFSEPNFRYRHRDFAAPDDKLLLLGSSTTPPWNMSTSWQEESMSNHLSFQEYMEGSKHRRGSGRSNHKRPLNLLLPVVDQTGASEKRCSLSNERAETNADGIDLDLRL